MRCLSDNLTAVDGEDCYDGPPQLQQQLPSTPPSFSNCPPVSSLIPLSLLTCLGFSGSASVSELSESSKRTDGVLSL